METVVANAGARHARRHVVGWLLGLIALTAALACWPGSRALAPDYVQFWSASRILTFRGNPYDPVLQARENAAVGWRIEAQGVGRYSFLPYYYPPWLALVLVPLVPLGYDVARCVWLALLIEAVVAIAFLLRRQIPQLAPAWAMVVVGGFGVWWTALPIGQTAPLVVLLVVAVWRLAEAGRDWLAGIALAWLSLKPQLALLMMAGVLIWAVRQSRWKILIGFAACMTILLGVSTWLVRDWLPAMLDAPRVTPLVTAENPWMGATWFCLLRWLGLDGPAVFLAYAVIAVPTTAMVLWLAWNRRSTLLDLLGLACWAAPLVAPYARYYDLALMLVPLVALARQPLAGHSRAWLLATFTLVPIMAWIAYPGEVPPLVSQLEWIWMPLVLAGMALRSDQRNALELLATLTVGLRMEPPRTQSFAEEKQRGLLKADPRS